ncbi:hypothetical protein A1O7_01819 [Cladophialophora yegresii CBS 114405]|uniref:3-hydroxybutyrate dehydrogenase n=1 Tax=Cladophialophora yegresii CBS 114405 TaxID=1182544 RepID=W9WC11_9EURO|nr:uncharacterized protein A1O7_01819 [Cladophialophora yegresii CBS 114405]EXJ65478.1 hypothetical protein A1O7_01819 [Cladophialophora yegresii CBS 114405]
MDELAGKIAFVTGGGSGIGLAFIKRLSQAGCNTFVADLRLHPDAKAWIESLGEHHSTRFRHSPVDVTDWEQLEAAFKQCREVFGVPDIVVPGAGVYEPNSNSFWEDCDHDSHYKVLDINLIHPIKSTRIAIRHLVEAGKKDAVILHISSVAGQRASVVTPLYTLSKHGINSFVRSLADLQHIAGIRVVAVAPGNVGTPLWTEHQNAMKFLDMSTDFLLPPDDVARAMLALVTDKKYVAGTVLEVCDTDNWREVGLLNDPGPRGSASVTSRKHEGIISIMPFLTQASEPAKLPQS